MMVHLILPEPLLHRKDCVLLDADGCVRKRSLVRRSIHNQKIQGLSNTANSRASSSHADTNSATSASYSDADSYRYADSDCDANSYGDSYSNPYCNAYSNTNPDSNSLSVRQTDHRVFYVGSFEHSNRCH